MKLRDLKAHLPVYHLLINLLKFDDEHEELRGTPESLRHYLTENSITAFGDIDITPIATPTTDNKGVIHDVSQFCRLISEYIGDNITPEVLADHKELSRAFEGILHVINNPKRITGSKTDALVEKQFLTEMADVISAIMEDIDGDSEESDSENPIDGVDIEDIDIDGTIDLGDSDEEEDEEEEPER